MVDRVVGQLKAVRTSSVNLGGNEPLFTNGPDPEETLLPYVVESLAAVGIRVGLTTSGITVVYLARKHQHVLRLLNDVDVSLDSPIAEEHNRNRGALLYDTALRALDVCRDHGIDCSIILCAMTWNFSPRHIDALLDLAIREHAIVRVNPIKPVEPRHLDVFPTVGQFYAGFHRLMARTEPLDLSEPVLAAATGYAVCGCPCGRMSLRINSITPDGRIPVSPCVYVHDYQTGDLLLDDLATIVRSGSFDAFRSRHAHPEEIPGCRECRFLPICRGGCAARSYYWNLHHTGRKTLLVKDPYCPADFLDSAEGRSLKLPNISHVVGETKLVHKDYLCTWIGRPIHTT
jgi:radical SAM protein with 4Fe4S-binding SPASM domain